VKLGLQTNSTEQQIIDLQFRYRWWLAIVRIDRAAVVRACAHPRNERLIGELDALSKELRRAIRAHNPKNAGKTELSATTAAVELVRSAAEAEWWGWYDRPRCDADRVHANDERFSGCAFRPVSAATVR